MLYYYGNNICERDRSIFAVDEKENSNKNFADADAVAESAAHASKMKKRIIIVFAVLSATLIN